MIGDNIKRLMKVNGYKQKELAIRSGCTESSISKYANNEREPSIKALKNLAIALGVTVDELLGNATADVVPREEVDRLRHTLNSYALQYGTVKDQHAVIDHIKTETAREIFGELETVMKTRVRRCVNEDGVITPLQDSCWRIEIGDYAQIKKKYTEDSPDGKRTGR